MNLILCATNSGRDAADILSARLRREVMQEVIADEEEGFEWEEEEEKEDEVEVEEGGDRESNLPAMVSTRTSLNFLQQLPRQFAFLASMTTERITGSWLSI